MPLLCNYFSLHLPCRVALQGDHYFSESNFVEGLDEVASDLTPSLLLKAVHRKQAECVNFNTILASLGCNCLRLVALDTLFGIQGHILKASAKKLVIVHLLEPVILHIFLGIIASADPQPIKALAKEEFSCTLPVEELSHVVAPG